MKRYWVAGLALAGMLALAAGRSSAQGEIWDVQQQEARQRLVTLPYVFYTEDMSLSFGVGSAWSGWPAPESVVFGTLLASVNGTVAAYGGGTALPVPPAARLFLDPLFGFGRFEKVRVYAPGNPDFPAERAGAHGSSEENYYEATGFDGWLQLKFRYLLPLGSGRDTIVPRYRVSHGLLKSGATGGGPWNPLAGGRTFLIATPFFRDQSLATDAPAERDSFSDNGLKLGLRHDNTDFPMNPSRGSVVELDGQTDPGLLGGSDSWQVWTAAFSKYVDLGETGWFRQQVLALSAWAADTPSWDQDPGPPGAAIRNRPPYFDGATLGGFYRLRAYPQYRFNARSAVCYSVEYRIMPRWDPFPRSGLLGLLEEDWWQLVPFVEVGRVADVFNLGELHRDMNWDAGLGVRAMMRKCVVRLDLAASEEGPSATAMIGHPF